jgi:hypothetical protein
MVHFAQRIGLPFCRGEAFQEVEFIEKLCKTMQHGTPSRKSRESIAPTARNKKYYPISESSPFRKLGVL